MATVALIGVDGAGKTTLSRKLLASFPLPWKYIYMGRNIESSNYALLSSRFIHWLKVRKYRKQHKLDDTKLHRPVTLHDLNEDRKEDTRGKLGATFRMFNRMAEEWYRQIIALYFQARGYVILYDRHFLFDALPDNLDSSLQKSRWSNRFHRWVLYKYYPKPDLVIYLEAPPELLYRRKKEASLEYLSARSEAFLQLARNFPNVIIVDAAQSAEKVYQDVAEKLYEFFQKRAPRKLTGEFVNIET